MKNKRSYLFFFCMLVVTMSAFRLLRGDQGATISVDLSKQVAAPSEQPRTERNFRRFEVERRFCIGAEGETTGPLHGPLSASVDAQGNAYIVDFADLRIQQYSPRGEYLRTFGGGRGEQEGQFQSVSDLRALPDGELWVADLVGKKIDVFSPGARLQRTVRPSRPPYRLVPDKNNAFTLMLPLASDHLFGHFRADGAVQAEFGRLVDDRLKTLALDGWIGQAGDGSLLYIPYYFGWIASYGPDGNLKYLRKTVDRVPSPVIHRSANGVVWVDPDTRVSAKGAWVNGNDLYLLAGNTLGSRLSRVVDVYDAGTGTYRYSFETPEPGTMALVQGNLLYVVKNTSVCQWSLRPAGTLQAAR